MLGSAAQVGVSITAESDVPSRHGPASTNQGAVLYILIEHDGLPHAGCKYLHVLASACYAGSLIF
jgi:hypothetical protein